MHKPKAFPSGPGACLVVACQFQITKLGLYLGLAVCAWPVGEILCLHAYIVSEVRAKFKPAQFKPLGRFSWQALWQVPEFFTLLKAVFVSAYKSPTYNVESFSCKVGFLSTRVCKKYRQSW